MADFNFADIREIAGEFGSSTAYAVGDYCIRNNLLYKFKTAHPAGAWNAAHVDQVTTASELKLKAAQADVDSLNTALTDLDYNEKVANQLSDYALRQEETSAITYEVSHLTLTKNGSSRYESSEIPFNIFCKINFNLSDANYMLSVRTGTATGKSWATGSFDYTVEASARKVYLWFKKADNSAFIDSDKDAILNALTITYTVGTIYPYISDEIDSSIFDLQYHDIFENKNGTKLESSGSNQRNCVFNSDGSITIQAGGYCFYAFKVIGDAIGDVWVRIKQSNDSPYSIAHTNDPNGYSSLQPYIQTKRKEVGEFYAIITENDYYEGYPYYVIRFDNRSGSSDITIYSIEIYDSHITGYESEEKLDYFYVSTDGSDATGDGTNDLPYATVNYALAQGASTVFIKEGVYNQNINLSYAKHANIEIKNATNDRRVIFELNHLLANTETKVSGYTKIYSFQVPTSAVITDRQKWIYQDMVNDVDTLISDTERHPLQRGYEYRCEDTKIIRCTATILADALNEIESASGYCWFYDADNNTIYYSRPSAVTENNPICYSVGSYLFLNGTKKHSVKCVGIETKYICFNVFSLNEAVVIDCKASEVFGAGCFRYDNTRSATFIRCEAVRANNNGTGDGFNAHTDKTGVVFSKQTDCSLIDCWSHDNMDDGYSDHERSEIIIRGGLYEYNGKAGVTPSYGSHATIYDVYSRKNYAGFLYTGAAALDEGGKYGQMICYNCIAEDNNTGGTMVGFGVRGEGNKMILYNCESIGNPTGYLCDTNALADIIDCKTYNCTTAKDGGGTFNIKNGTLLT